MAPELGVVSVERISQELRKMLVGRHRSRAMELCRELGLLEIVLPEMAEFDPAPDDTLAILDRLQAPTFAAALATLLRKVSNPPDENRRAVSSQGTVRAACRRLKLSNQDTDDCLWLHEHCLDLLAANQMTAARLKRLLASPLIDSLFGVASAHADALGLDGSGLEKARDRRSAWSPEEINPAPLITGNDALDAGAQAGPRLRELLLEVREAQLNDEVVTRDEALALLRERLRPGSAPGAG